MKKINSLEEYKKNEKKKKTIILVSQIGIFLLIFFVWEFFTKWNIINPFLLSSPSNVINLLGTYIQNGEIFSHIYITTIETLIGLIISLVGGILIATILYMVPILSKITEPFLVLLNALPKSAIAPILIIWLGTGVKGIVGVCISFVMVITIINTLTHFQNVDEDLIKMLRSMKANRLQILLKVVFPANIMNLLSTMKVCIGLSLVGVIVGEYLSSRRGLGYLIMYGGQVFKLDLVMMGIFILSILAFLLYGTIVIIEKLVRKKYKL